MFYAHSIKNRAQNLYFVQGLFIKKEAESAFPASLCKWLNFYYLNGTGGSILQLCFIVVVNYFFAFVENAGSCSHR